MPIFSYLCGFNVQASLSWIFVCLYSVICVALMYMLDICVAIFSYLCGFNVQSSLSWIFVCLYSVICVPIFSYLCGFYAQASLSPIFVCLFYIYLCGCILVCLFFFSSKLCGPR